MSGFSLDGEDYYLEYEGLHFLCTNCGMYGHRPEECKVGAKRFKANTTSVDGDGGAMVEEAKTKEETEIWKVVQKPRRQWKGKEKQKGNLWQQPQSSRYDILAGEEMTAEENNAQTVPIVQDGGEVQKDVVRTKEVRGSKGKKGGNQKRQNKRAVRSNEHDMEVVPLTMTLCKSNENLKNRKEKRTREILRKEEYGDDRVEPMEQEANIEYNNQEGSIREAEDEEMMGSRDEDLLKAEIPPMLPHDPGEHKVLNGPYGKFWAKNPEESPGGKCEEEVESGMSLGTMVPETQST